MEAGWHWHGYKDKDSPLFLCSPSKKLDLSIVDKLGQSTCLSSGGARSTLAPLPFLALQEQEKVFTGKPWTLWGHSPLQAWLNCQPRCFVWLTTTLRFIKQIQWVRIQNLHCNYYTFVTMTTMWHVQVLPVCDIYNEPFIYFGYLAEPNSSLPLRMLI